MKPAVSIRPGKGSDLKAIKSCAEAAYDIYVERIGRKPAPMVADFAASIAKGEMSVAEIDGALSGFVVFFPKSDYLFLENIAVAPAMQGFGVGAQLVQHVETAARKQGYTRVELYTNARMTENLDLYPHLGYEQFDHRTEDGFDRVYFRKSL